MTDRAAGIDYVETTVKVRYAETDQMGVVYHANYIIWFEIGRVAWCRARGFSYGEMESRDDRYLMVAEADCRYKSPARFEDDIIIRTSLGKAGDRVIRYNYEIIRKRDLRPLASGHTAHVVVNRDYRPSRLPDRYREAFKLPPRK
ncbi:MAG TPA: thioesterase family protein [Acidobacteriota bacterium]|nr:thioesterase family protein [Acidobacteriota bacterium]